MRLLLKFLFQKFRFQSDLRANDRLRRVIDALVFAKFWIIGRKKNFAEVKPWGAAFKFLRHAGSDDPFQQIHRDFNFLARFRLRQNPGPLLVRGGEGELFCGTISRGSCCTPTPG